MSKQKKPKDIKIIVPESDEDPGIQTVPILPLSGVLVFPYTLSPLVIEGDTSIEMVQEATKGDRLIGLFPEIPPEPEEGVDLDLELSSHEVEERAISGIGVLGRIVKLLKFPDNTVRVLVRGLRRIRFLSPAEGRPQHAIVETVIEPEDDSIETVAMVRNAIKQFQEIITYSPHFPEELKIAILNVDDSVRVVDLIADSLGISYMEKLNLINLETLHDRLQLLTILLNREVEVLHLGSEIQSQVHNALSKSQREYFLREQLRTIKQELGEENQNPDIAHIDEQLLELDLPEKVVDAIMKEKERLEMIPQASSEYHVAYNYVDWLLTVPWNNYSDDQLNISDAAKILDADHYDLKDVKERILEFLAVLQLKKDRKSPILCFVGPPGVGKTSLGKSIARAMGREFVRMSLGGVRDEAEIRGHRRTYVGALPGRIIQGVKRAGTSNPVFMLDEIDKLGNDFRGDPASALLEVLDPQQNSAFNDHYLELDYDLSSVMFIATANILDTIPPALIDRMEIIRLPGYTAMEKKQIAKRFLIPRQLQENGVKQRQLFFTMASIDEMINHYTREAGVRNLERTIGSIARKYARQLVEEKVKEGDRKKLLPEHIQASLGPRRFLMDEATLEPELAVVTGLAWTSSGGTILPVEVTKMPGKGSLQLTGSLGDVMKESAQTAFSFVRSCGDRFKIDPAVFKDNDFHIHVPDGATPKDGPSAGITITTALVSLLTSRMVRPALAMTGEVTLRGKVTAVGGIKEKVIAALRSGIKTVIMPKANEKDLEDIPDEVRNKLSFMFVDTAEQALKYVLMKS